MNQMRNNMRLADEINESFKFANPSDAKMVNDVVNASLHLVTQYHFWHLQTKSYAQHEALGEFYECLNTKLDSLAEHAIGIGGSISAGKAPEFKDFNQSDAINKLKEFGEMVSKVNESLSDVGSIAVVLDEIEGLVSQTLYKLGLK
jgi:DNA-binding ferritin-like protein